MFDGEMYFKVTLTPHRWLYYLFIQYSI